MILFVAFSAALFTMVQAYNFGLHQGRQGIGSPPLSSAGQAPNLTSSVKFDFADLSPEQFEWRVNITSIPVPIGWNTTSNPPVGVTSHSYSEGLQVISTEWGLYWPGSNDNTSLGDYLNAHNYTFTFGAYQGYMPLSVFSLFESAGNGPCAPILGQQCTTSLIQAVFDNGGQASLQGLSGCNNTADLISSSQGEGTAYSPPSNQPRLTNTSDPLYFAQSPGMQMNNLTYYNQTAGLLQLLVAIEGDRASDSGRLATAATCQVVQPYNATKDSAATQSSAAAWQHQGAAGLLIAALFGAIAFLL